MEQCTDGICGCSDIYRSHAYCTGPVDGPSSACIMVIPTRNVIGRLGSAICRRVCEFGSVFIVMETQLNDAGSSAAQMQLSQFRERFSTSSTDPIHYADASMTYNNRTTFISGPGQQGEQGKLYYASRDEREVLRIPYTCTKYNDNYVWIKLFTRRRKRRKRDGSLEWFYN